MRNIIVTCAVEIGAKKRKGRAGPGWRTQVSTRQSIVHSEGLVKIIIKGRADLLPSGQAMKKERFIAQKACDAKPYLTSRSPFGMT